METIISDLISLLIITIVAIAKKCIDAFSVGGYVLVGSNWAISYQLPHHHILSNFEKEKDYSMKFDTKHLTQGRALSV